jgi:hypothetical protein
MTQTEWAKIIYNVIGLKRNWSQHLLKMKVWAQNEEVLAL